MRGQRLARLFAKAASGLGLLVLVTTPAQGATEPAPGEAIDPPSFGSHTEHRIDLRVKVLGGSVKMARTWRKGRWEFNRRWNPLVERYEDGATRPSALVRNGHEYPLNNGAYVDPEEPGKRIVPLDGGGYRWEDVAGNWIRYDADRRAVAYGGRNDVEVTLEYDSAGRLTAVRDHHGDPALTLTYNADGRLTRVEDRAGRTVRYAYSGTTYESGPKLAEVTDVRGNTWSYEYAGDRLTAKTDPKGRTTRLEYHPNGTLKGKTDPGGSTTRYEHEYNSSQGEYIKRVEKPEGLIVETRYNDSGEPIRIEENGELVRKHRHGDRKRVTIDPAGNETTREYDEWDNLIRVTHPDGATERYTYRAGTDLRTKAVDENGTVTDYTYDDNGNLTRKVEAAGTDAERTTTYEYDQYGRVTAITRQADAVTEAATVRLEYDAYGNVTKRTGPEGGVQTFDHNVRGQATRRVDARGNVWKRGYDAAGNLLSRTDPLGNTTTFEYDKAGNRGARTDALGNTTTFAYDANDNLVGLTDPAGATTEFAYDAAGRLTAVTDPTGVRQTLAYDAFGRPKSLTDGVGNTITYGYDRAGTGDPDRPTAVTFPTFQQSAGFDSRGRPTRDVRAPGTPLEQVRQRTYSEGGRVVARTDPNGRTTEFSHDALGRVVKTTDPAGGVTRLQYDDRDNLIGVTNARGVEIRRFEYDRADRRTAVIWPSGETVRYRYDAAGNMVEKLNARGQAIRHTYDAAGRRTQSAYHSDPSAAADRTETFRYNAAGRLTAYTGSTTSGTYTYDDAGRRTGATIDYGAFTKSYAYAYYANGLKRSFTAPDGTTYGYRYDEANRLKGIKIPDLGGITYHDFQWNRPTRVSRPGGGVEKQAFDRLMRIKAIRARDPAGNPLMAFDYTYDQAGNIIEKATEHGDYTYAYDKLDQLVRADNPHPLPDEAYTYDPVGNRKTDSQVPGEWTYNAADQLLSYGKYEQAFDADGNLVRKTNTQTGTVTEYRYNVAGRLVEVSEDGTTIAAYAYDPFGRRVQKETADGVRYFVYAEEGLVAELDGQGGAIRSYGYQPDGLWTTDPAFLKTNGEYAFYQNDHLGTPQKLVGASGAEKWAARYEAFGKAHPNISNLENPLRFPGQYHDAETGKHYNYFRDYEPENGRYIASDPIGLTGGLNTYSYLRGSPTKNFDPFGLYTLDDAQESLEEKGVKPKVKGYIWDSYSNKQIFDEWLRLEKSSRDWLDELPPCPNKIEMCTGGNWNEPQEANHFHPGGDLEVRSTTTEGGHSNQCVYDDEGNLLTNFPAAGSADYASCPSPPFCPSHYYHDVKPFDLSQELDRVEDYYDVRPVIH